MSTKFTKLGTPGCNPKVPLHIYEAAFSRESARNDIADKKSAKTPKRPNGGKGCRKIQRLGAKLGTAA